MILFIRKSTLLVPIFPPPYTELAFQIPDQILFDVSQIPMLVGRSLPEIHCLNACELPSLNRLSVPSSLNIYKFRQSCNKDHRKSSSSQPIFGGDLSRNSSKMVRPEFVRS